MKNKYKYTQDELKEIPILAPLSLKQEIYLNDDRHDVVIWGGGAGSGKSFLSILDMLIKGYEDKHYRAAIVRRTKEQLRGSGSLWDEMNTMYSSLKTKIKLKEHNLKAQFANGCEIKMNYSDADKDKHNYQGWQCTTFLVDEAQQLREDNVRYLMSRLRSKSTAKHQLKLTCNPQYESFLREWLEKGGYLLESGIPDPEMDGKTVYFAEVGGVMEFRQTLEEFSAQYGDSVDPQSLVFYSANVTDNPYICKHQPSYVKKLKNLVRIEYERLFLGSWYAKEEASGYFKREWCEVVSKFDLDYTNKQVRAWDKAATLPSEAYPDPDWSVGIKGMIDEHGDLVVIDMQRFRDRSAVVQRRITEIAEDDGKHVVIAIPRDVGAAGKESSEYSQALLNKAGFNVVINAARKAKQQRFEPVLIKAQNRQLKVVKADWNQAFFEELEHLDFSKRGGHDDIADALSDLYTTLNNKLFVPVIKANRSRSMKRNTLLCA